MHTVSKRGVFFNVGNAGNAVVVLFIAKSVSLQRQSARNIDCIRRRKRCVRRLRLALTVYVLTNSAVGLLAILLSGGRSPGASWRHFGIGSMGRSLSSKN